MRTTELTRWSDANVGRMTASNYYGARHAVETVFQLVVWDEVEARHLMLDRADIMDWPEFPHRGISVDTVRNFIPVHTIKTVKLASHFPLM